MKGDDSMVNSIGKFIVMILIVMAGIYGVKWLSSKYNIPVVSNLAQAV
jgi:hypothetical protein